MRKLMTAVFPQSVLIFYLTLSLIVVGDINMANGQNTPTLEGEWEVMSSWAKSQKRSDRFIIVRKGDVYKTSWKSQAGDTKDYDFHGTPTQIMATYISSYDDLIYEFDNPQDDAFRSALRQLAGKVTKRRRITLSADGRSAEYACDTLYVNYGMRSGRLVNYEIQPFAGIITLVRVSGPEQAKAKKPITSAVAEIESRGEFYVLTKDGRKLTGKDANQIPLEEGTKVITGSSGHVRMKLPDDTTFTIGPNSDMIIDSFIYDPDNTPKEVIASVSKGVFRWVTGKVKPLQDPAEMKVKLPVIHIGIRGTDFEVTVNPDGSGSVVLHFGQLEITENKTGFTFILNAGYKATFNADGSISRPIKVD